MTDTDLWRIYAASRDAFLASLLALRDGDERRAAELNQEAHRLSEDYCRGYVWVHGWPWEATEGQGDERHALDA